MRILGFGFFGFGFCSAKIRLKSAKIPADFAAILRGFFGDFEGIFGDFEAENALKFARQNRLGFKESQRASQPDNHAHVHSQPHSQPPIHHHTRPHSQ